MIGRLVREKGFFEYLDERDYFRRTDEEYCRLIKTKLRLSQTYGLKALPE